MEGDCDVLLKPFGPDHVQVMVPGETVFAERFNVESLHTGPLEVMVGITGVESISTTTVPAGDAHASIVTVTE
jgi:hypothetical protein